jgi:hypothetical protein
MMEGVVRTLSGGAWPWRVIAEVAKDVEPSRKCVNAAIATKPLPSHAIPLFRRTAAAFGREG